MRKSSILCQYRIQETRISILAKFKSLILDFALVFSSSLIVVLAGCSSAPRPLEKNEGPIPALRTAPLESKKPKPIDLVSLKKTLNLTRPKSQLGLREAIFENCSASPNARNCPRSYFVSIHIRLQCREVDFSSDYIPTEDDIKTIANRKLTWNLESFSGESQTDAEGYSQIDFVSDHSASKRPLRISDGTDFLIIRANEVTRIVAPKDWCK